MDNTPYDDVFRTLLTDCTELMIPVVNEIFQIIPIEVKSSGYKTHKSLDIFTEKFSDRILCRYLVYTKDISKEQDIFCIPVYMVPFL